MKASHKLLTGLVLFAIPLESRAQELLYEIQTDYTVVAVNADIDINSDGVNDLVVGNCDPNNIENLGQARAYSGSNGDLMWTTGSYGAYGWSISSCSDVNADGVEDLLIGAPGLGSRKGGIFVISGANGNTIWDLPGENEGYELGRSVSRLRDINGDGFDEVIVGEPYANNDINGLMNVGKAYVLSGIDGTEIYTWHGDGEGDAFGYAVTSLDDVNADGIEDIAVGAPNDDNLLGSSGSLRIFSGADGSILTFSINGASSGEGFASVLCRVEDLNSDGLDDLLVQSTNYGRVRAMSATDNSAILELTGSSGFGSSLSSVGDINLDGVGDLLVQNNQNFYGRSQILSGANGTPLTNEIQSPHGNSYRSGAVAGLGDINGDGNPDYAIGWSYRVRVYAGDPFLGENYCISTAHTGGLSAQIGATGSSSVAGNNLSLQVTDAVSDQFGIFYYGTGRNQVPFGYGWRCANPPFRRLPIVQLDASGNGQHSFDNTPNPAIPESLKIYAGRTFNFQFWFRDPAAGGPAFNLSDAVEITFSP